MYSKPIDSDRLGFSSLDPLRRGHRVINMELLRMMERVLDSKFAHLSFERLQSLDNRPASLTHLALRYTRRLALLVEWRWCSWEWLLKAV